VGQALVYGVASSPVAGLIGAAIAVLSAVTIAAAVPAWRAARVDPNVALRV